MILNGFYMILCDFYSKTRNRAGGGPSAGVGGSVVYSDPHFREAPVDYYDPLYGPDDPKMTPR